MLRVDLDNWQQIAKRIDDEVDQKHALILACTGQEQQDQLEVLILRQQVKLEFLAYLIDYLQTNKSQIRESFYQQVLAYVNKNISPVEARELFQQGIVPVANNFAVQIVGSVLSIPVDAYSALAQYISSKFPDTDKLKLARKQHAAVKREAIRQKYHLAQPADIEIFDDGADLGAKLYAIKGIDFSEIPDVISSAAGEQDENLQHELGEITHICKELQNPTRFYTTENYQDLKAVRDSLRPHATHALFEMDEEREAISEIRKRVAKEHVRRLRINQAVMNIDNKLKLSFPNHQREFEQFAKNWRSIHRYAAVTPSALSRIFHHFDALGVYLRGYIAYRLPQLDISVAKKLKLISVLTEALIAANQELESVQNTMQAWMQVEQARKLDVFSPTQAPKYHNPVLNAYYRLHEMVGANTAELNASLIKVFNHEDRVIDEALLDQYSGCLAKRRQLEAAFLEQQRVDSPPILMLTESGMDQVDLEDSYQLSGNNSIVLSYNQDLTASLLPDPIVRLLTPDSDLNEVVSRVMADYVSRENFELCDSINLLSGCAILAAEDSDEVLQARLDDIERMVEQIDGECLGGYSVDTLHDKLRENGIQFATQLSALQADTIVRILTESQQEFTHDVKLALQLYLNITTTFADKISDENHRNVVAPLFVNGGLTNNVMQQVVAIENEVDRIRALDNSDESNAAALHTLKVAYNMVLTPDSDKARQQLFGHAKAMRTSQHGKRLFGLLYGLGGVVFGLISAVTFSWCKKSSQAIIEDQAASLVDDESGRLLDPVQESVRHGGFFAQKARAFFARSHAQFQGVKDDQSICNKLYGLTRSLNRD